MHTSDRMNIGVYVRSLTPKSPAEARFQSAVFAGLQRADIGDRYRFLVFSHDVPAHVQNGDKLDYVTIKMDGRGTQAARFLKLQAGGAVRFACRVLGAGGSDVYRRISRWMRSEPRYFKQVRDLNVRLMWNVNQHELPAPVPGMRTMWDVNHRIHSMYPEFSYTRGTFDGCDANTGSLASTSYVIVGTQEGKQQLVDMFGVHESKIRVIPLPTPTISSAPEHAGRQREPRSREPYLFYPARFWPHKNHVVIIGALKILREQWNIRLSCVFTGIDEGNLAYVMEYANRQGVKDQIEYLGLVSDEDVALLYKEALALVYACAVGPDNLPPLEAMSLGCPVITAEVPGAREQYGDAALYFPPTNERELASRIKELLERGAVRDTLISRGRERAASWTSDDYMTAIVSILDEFTAIARAWERCDSVFT